VSSRAPSHQCLFEVQDALIGLLLLETSVFRMALNLPSPLYGVTGPPKNVSSLFIR